MIKLITGGFWSLRRSPSPFCLPQRYDQDSNPNPLGTTRHIPREAQKSSCFNLGAANP